MCGEVFVPFIATRQKWFQCNFGKGSCAALELFICKLYCGYHEISMSPEFSHGPQESLNL